MPDISSKKVSRRYLDSSSFKMALLFTVLLSLAAVILGYLLINFGRQDFMRETEAAIDAEITMLTVLATTDHAAFERYLSERPRQDSFAQFRHESAAGRLIAGNLDPLPPVAPLTEGVLRFSLLINGESRRYAAKVHTFGDGSRIIVARDIHGQLASYQRLRNLSMVIIGMMLAVILVSFGISYFVVSRINHIAAIAWNMATTGDLSQRISVDSQWDDLSNLSQVLNGFLERIETLMRGIREVSNNIAHDLRTPLMGLRSDIESLKNQLPRQAVGEPELDALLSEADRILAIFQALLRITNLEKGKRHQPFGCVDLHALLHDVVELYEPLAEEKQVKLSLDTPAAAALAVAGDADLLFQLFANLLDNAIKFSPSGGTVALSAQPAAARIAVYIRDQGPGISTAEKEEVFKHFYRSDRSRSLPGNGLGLSLVKAVVEHHHGGIRLHDGQPGLNVEIELSAYEKLRLG